VQVQSELARVGGVYGRADSSVPEAGANLPGWLDRRSVEVKVVLFDRSNTPPGVVPAL